jgi:hypothetical protein
MSSSPVPSSAPDAPDVVARPLPLGGASGAARAASANPRVTEPEDSMTRQFVLESLAYFEGVRNQSDVAPGPVPVGFVSHFARVRAARPQWRTNLWHDEQPWADFVMQDTSDWLLRDGIATAADLYVTPMQAKRMHSVPALSVLHACPGCEHAGRGLMRVWGGSSYYSCASCGTCWRSTDGVAGDGGEDNAGLIADLIRTDASVSLWAVASRVAAAVRMGTSTPPVVIDGGGALDVAARLQADGWDAFGMYASESMRGAARVAGIDGAVRQLREAPRAQDPLARLFVAVDPLFGAGAGGVADIMARVGPGGAAVLALPNHESWQAGVGRDLWVPGRMPERTIVWSRRGIETSARRLPGVTASWHDAPPEWGVATWARTRQAGAPWFPFLPSLERLARQPGWRVLVLQRAPGF